MTIAHLTAVRNVLADAVDNYINTTGGGTAKLRIRDGSTTIVDFDLANPAFGAAASGVITVSGSLPIAAVAVASGEVDGFQLLARDGTSVVVSGTVTATGGGGDIEVTNINVASGQDCELDSLTYTAPA